MQALLDGQHQDTLFRLKQIDALQQRLNEADQRIDEMKGATRLLREFRDVAYGGFLDNDHVLRTRADLDAFISRLTKHRPTCCVQTPEEKALLASGDYTSSTGPGGKPSCPKCHASPSNPGNLISSTTETKP